MSSSATASSATPSADPNATIIETSIPARLDRLQWSRFHTLVVVALGITWILDGLEVTLVGSLSGAFREGSLKFSSADVGFVATVYLAGAILGATFFGWLTDRLGRKTLFFITLAVYLVATAATAFTWNLWSFALCRFFTGAGIGGEYAAINSTIQELIPARYRGHTDLAINGSFWVGAAAGAGSSIVLLDPDVISLDYGWRLAFLIGAALGLIILFMRMWIPESPRWLATHGRAKEAEAAISEIEKRAGVSAPPHDLPKVRLRQRSHTPLAEVWQAMFVTYRQRTMVGLTLMASQAFFYNAVFFTYALILTDFYGVPSQSIGWYLLPFALGNFLGPVLLGRLFDTIGRRFMISLTFGLSGLMLTVTGYLFYADLVSAQGQTLAWIAIFFVASAASSSAYLTAAESFPLEIRALGIAFFYAIGTGIGGMFGPWLFGALIGSGSRGGVFAGYMFGATLMIAASFIEWRFGLDNEGKSLEDVAPPLALEK